MLTNVHKKIYFHILAWIGFLLIILFSADDLDRVFILKSLSSVVPAFFLFYGLILWVFPNYLIKEINFKVILLTFSLSIAAVFIRPLFVKFFSSDLYWPLDRITFWVQYRYNILFVGMAFAYHYASELIKGEHQRKVLEKENADAKLALLKNQVNPHFLYNTLSMIYAKALPLSGHLAEMIDQLSSLLRYSIAETDSEGKVPLEDELKYIEQYIRLNEARFDIKGNGKFQIEGPVSDYRIAPMLLISFIENAYKHGRPDRPVLIFLRIDQDELTFCVENHIGKGKKDKSSGIGLQNVKSRLELLYPDRHLLQMENAEGLYKICLKIW